MNQEVLLSDYLKLWLKSKLHQFYRQDPYLKHLHTDVALSQLNDSLISSVTVADLSRQLKQNDYTRGLRFTRKLDGNTHFEYPSIAFQTESLLALWPTICGSYLKHQLLQKNNRFGHRPHLESNFSDLTKNAAIKERDIKVNCALKIPFQEDYPNFKNAVVSFANEVLKPMNEKNEYVLVIQSDIHKFYHSLELSSVCRFLNSNFPDIGKIAEPYINRLKSDFEFHSLPIGWPISGVLADMISSSFHRRFEKTLNSQLHERLFKLDIAKYGETILSREECSEANIKKLHSLVRTSAINHRHSISYVDDFIFLLSFKASEGFDDSRLLKSFEKIVSNLVIDIAEELINSTFENKLSLKLYRPDGEKGKHFTFDKSNVDTLSSNFFNLANNAVYDPEEPSLWHKLDEFLLPADNELTLNERTQFFSHLAGIRHKILEGEKIEKKELTDIFQKILIKTRGAEAKYIASILKLIETLLISDFEAHIEFGLSSIQKIIAEFQKSAKPLELWLRFFSSYFRIYSRLRFKP